MPSCIHPEVRLLLDQRILCSDCCKKMYAVSLAQEVFFYFVLHSSKIPVVLATKVAHLHSPLFRQPDGVDCVVRRVYFGVEKWLVYYMDVNRCVHAGLCLYLLTFIGDLRYKILLI